MAPLPGKEFKVDFPSGSGTLSPLMNSQPNSPVRFNRNFSARFSGKKAALRGLGRDFAATQTGKISFCSMNTSTVIQAPVLGASHQTGWTSLVKNASAERRSRQTLRITSQEKRTRINQLSQLLWRKREVDRLIVAAESAFRTAHRTSRLIRSDERAGIIVRNSSDCRKL